MADQSTALVQHWMKTVITGYGQLGDKLKHARKQYNLLTSDVILENEIAGTVSRLSVYTNGYVLRLLECLSADYSAVRTFTGIESFNHFASAYLSWKPSTSFTLYDLGKAFPEFLEKSKPVIPGISPEQEILLQLPTALALLERARQEAVLDIGTENDDSVPSELGIEDLFFHGLMVVTPPCLRLLTLPFPILPVYEALQSEAGYELPEPKTTYMAISRKNYRLVMNELEHWQFIFLSNCSVAIDILSVIQRTSDACSIPSDALLADLYIWLPLLKQQGFIIVKS